jgi:hypothetical protein
LNYFSDIYALNGTNGKILPNWPLQLGQKISTNVLITKISTKHATADLVKYFFQLDI